MFYDKFASLCKKKGVTVSRGAQEAGISKSLVTKWKSQKTDIPSPDVLGKLSKYFELPISELLEEASSEQVATQRSRIDAQELKYALFKGREHITDTMLDEVLSFAEYVAQREEKKHQQK